MAIYSGTRGFAWNGVLAIKGFTGERMGRIENEIGLQGTRAFVREATYIFKC